jgi:disulfide bond formation protein DsbB
MSIQVAKESRPLTLRTNAAIALFVGGASAALLLGALAFQYVGGLAPCEMCIWQRWPHGVAILLGLGGGLLGWARVLPERSVRAIALVAIAAIAVSGLIGIFHAGVEWKLWPGPAACTGFGYVPGADDFNVFKVVRCDEAQWRLFGISLAGYNAVFSLGVAALGLGVLRRAKP